MNEKQTTAPPSGVQAASAMPHNMSQRCWTAGCQRGRASLGTFGYCSKVCADVAAAPPVAPAPADHIRDLNDTVAETLRRALTTFDQVETDAHCQDALFEWWGQIADRLAEMKAALEKVDARAMLSAAAPADQPNAPPLASIPDAELPGMWQRADFMGGQDEVRPAEPPAVEADALIESIIDAAEDWTKDVIEDRCAVNIRVHLERAIAEFRAQSAAKGKP